MEDQDQKQTTNESASVQSPDETKTTVHASEQKVTAHNNPLVVVGIIIVLGIIGLAIAYALMNPSANTETVADDFKMEDTVSSESMESVLDDVEDEQSEDESAEEEDDAADEEIEEEPAVLGEADSEGIRWYSSWVQMEDIGLVEQNGANHYHTIGVLSDGRNLVILGVSGLGTSYYRFIEETDGSYTYLENYGAGDFESFLEWNQPTTVTESTDLTIQSLEAPETFQVGSIDVRKSQNAFARPTLFEKTDGTTLISTNEFGDVYEYARTATDQETEIEHTVLAYRLVIADGTFMTYVVDQSFLADDATVIADWAEGYESYGERTYMKSFLSSSGCGIGSVDEYVHSEDVEGLTSVGTTTAGDALYAPTDMNSSIVQVAYQTYSVGRSIAGGFEVLTLEEFAETAPVLVWAVPNGTYIGYMNSEYAPLAECGKPVIYLYPEVEQEVSVEVGADVTVSEPHYENGWTVTAQPNGDLTWTDGEVYPNLYWEGTGYGDYPEINFGRVVESVNIEAELLHDLRAQGLNEQESVDFMEFWMPLMPTTPYTRLSWFTTEQMNELAPLRVQPMPSTVQRVFLDFEGVETAEHNLAPQQLETFDRNGYTLVEWGGLLVGGHESVQ